MSIDVKPNTALVTCPRRVAMSVGQREERAVGQRVAVEQEQLACAHGASSVTGAVDPATTRVGDVAHRATRSLIAVLLDERERVRSRSGRARPSACPWPGRSTLRVSSCSPSVVDLVGRARRSSRKRPMATSIAGIRSLFWNGLTR